MNTPRNTPANTPQNTPADTPADKLIELNDRAAACVDDGTPAHIELLRITGTTRAPVAKIDAPDWDSFSVGEIYGGGRYMARLKIAGKFAVSATFDAEGPTIQKIVPFAGISPGHAPTPAQPSHNTDGLSSRDFLQLMMNQQSQQQQMFMQMMQANAQQTQLMIQTLVSKTRETPMGELLTTFEKMRGMADDAGGSSGPSMMGELAELGKALGIGPLISAVVAERMNASTEVKPQRRPVPNGARRHQPQPTPAKASPAPATPAEVNAAATEGETTEQKSQKLMLGQLKMLRQLARAGVNPRGAAHSLFGTVDDIEDDDVRNAVLDSIAATKPEDFANAIPHIAPEFAQPAHREWVIKVHTDLREMVAEAQEAENPDSPDNPDAQTSTADETNSGTADETKAESEK